MQKPKIMLYNTLTRRKEEFKPIDDDHVGYYTCGPTVYYNAHIGNMRTKVNEDVVYRVLKHAGYSVRHVMNLTDVGHLVGDGNVGEDKLRRSAREQHKSVYEIADYYTRLFMEDCERLNITRPEVVCKATEHIPEMTGLIDSLDRKGFLYRIDTGMYFDTSMAKDYGAMMGMTFDQLNAELKGGARVERVEGIRHITDFAVWRFAHGDEKEMVWDTRWGKGWPGWHIECSAMSMKYLGEHFDIHTGGQDLMSVHHPNEIAQSEGATGKKFVNYWMHFYFLNVDGQKMSKSLKNIYTVQDVLDKGYSAEALRLFYMSGSYRQMINFTFQAIGNMEKTLKGIYTLLHRLDEVRNGKTNADEKGFLAKIEKGKEEFFNELYDDINMPEALARMHGLMNEVGTRMNMKVINGREAKAAIAAFLEMDEVLGLGFEKEMKAEKEPLPDEAMRLIELREEARRAKDFKRADEIRDTLKGTFGIKVEDTEFGPRWEKE